MHIRRLLILLMVLLVVLGSVLPPAAADEPQNGQIPFGRFDPQLGDFSIWAANPDGTHQRRLTHVPSFLLGPVTGWAQDRVRLRG